MKRSISLNALKVLTMLLIINSHSDILYPSKIRFLASGGGIGNELFFLISGYLFSTKINIRMDIWKRFIRLYIPAYIMIVITLLLGKIHVNSVTTFVRGFIWPTHFWFVGAIFLYSIILYYLILNVRIEKKKSFVLFTLIIVSLDIILYILCIPDKSIWIVEDAYISIIPFRCVYSFFMFVLGYYIRKKADKFCNVLTHKGIIVLSITFFIAFYCFKWLINKGIVPMPMQIISQPLTIVSALFIFLAFVFMDLNPKLENTRIAATIDYISGISLESYLVQFLVISEMATLNIVFPLNLIVCVILVLFFAMLLQLIDRRVTKMILKNNVGR